MFFILFVIFFNKSGLSGLAFYVISFFYRRRRFKRINQTLQIHLLTLVLFYLLTQVVLGALESGIFFRAALEAVDGAVGALEPGSPVLAREVKDRWKRR